MHLVQLLLPLHDSAGRYFDRELYAEVSRELTDRFGGVTAYSRAPATGLWKETPSQTTRDDIVVYEVMVPTLDAAWWRKYREALEERFEQTELVVRAQDIRRL